MNRRSSSPVTYETVELDGVRYAILREHVLKEICRRAVVQVEASPHAGPPRDLEEIEQLDSAKLAAHLVARRRQAALSQAELARLAGIRVETLNRIERGKTTPDFATIRKVVLAIKKAETRLHA